MKKMLCLTVVSMVLMGAMSAYGQSRWLTNPLPPPADFLDRLNLRPAWQVRVPLESRRDGIAEVLPLGDQVLARTYSGTLMAIDAYSGHTQWIKSPSRSYAKVQAVGVNDSTVFLVNAETLYALKRSTGRQLWKHELPNIVTAPPVADEDMLYLCFAGGEFAGMVLPPTPAAPPPGELPAAPAATPPPESMPAGVRSQYARSTQGYTGYSVRASSYVGYEQPVVGPRPVTVFSHRLETRLDFPAMLSSRRVTVAGAASTFFNFVKGYPDDLVRFPVAAGVSAPPVAYEDVVYLAGEDKVVYAQSLETGFVRWRFLECRSPIVQQPAVTNENVYIVGASTGLHCLDRANGRLLWRNPDAQQFRAANPKYVYATNRSGEMLIIDRLRGTTLTAADWRFFNVPIRNVQTDRLFLAAHNGLLICVYDRDYHSPIWHRIKMEKKPQPPKENGKVGVG
ncbi:MAG: PQQ-binding-like beta-propeller repeat protein [Gemmataceae bacterium]